MCNTDSKITERQSDRSQAAEDWERASEAAKRMQTQIPIPRSQGSVRLKELMPPFFAHSLVPGGLLDVALDLPAQLQLLVQRLVPELEGPVPHLPPHTRDKTRTGGRWNEFTASAACCLYMREQVESTGP